MITIDSASNCFAFPLSTVFNNCLSNIPVERSTKKSFVEKGTAVIATTQQSLQTSNIHSGVGVAIVMNTGDRFLAHFNDVSAVTVSIDKSLAQIKKTNPDAQIVEIVMCGGLDSHASVLGTSIHGAKYGAMGLGLALPVSLPVCITASLGLYLSCSVCGPEQEVGSSVLREAVIKKVTELHEQNPSSKLVIHSVSEESPLFLMVKNDCQIVVCPDVSEEVKKAFIVGFNEHGISRSNYRHATILASTEAEPPLDLHNQSIKRPYILNFDGKKNS